MLTMNRRTMTVIAVIAIAIVALVLVRQMRMRGAQATEEYETVAAYRDTIVATVNASGSVLARRQVNLAFPLGGVVAEVLVEAGDEVAAGQILARLDTRQLEQAIAQAEANLKSAQARLDQTKTGPSAAELDAARASVDSAQAQYDAAKNQLGLQDEQLSIAEADLKRAELALNDAQAAYDLVAWRSDIGRLPQSGALEKATVDYERALANYRLQVAGIDDTAFRSAAAQLAQAETQLEQLEDMPTDEDIAIAEAQVEQTAASLLQAKLQLADAILAAPFSGTVAAVEVQAGEWVAATMPAIVLADLDHFYVDASVDETDIVSVEVGQDAEIVLDAFPDDSLPGKVTGIDPLGNTAQGVVSYGVDVEFLPGDLAVRPNMTAIVDIVVGRDEGALLVPNRAIRRDSSGRLYVEVLATGQVERKYVTIGLSNELVTEILEGLDEGEEVVVSAPRRNVLEEVSGPGPFGFGGD
jgi:RND family efflux transporter MFP subunit